MRDSSPYAGRTVHLRPDARDFGGLDAQVVDWYERTGNGMHWRDAITTDPRAQGYALRSSMAGLPDDDRVLFARVDGMGALIHVTEIVGESQEIPLDFGPKPVHEEAVGLKCPACPALLADGDTVAVRILGPGADPQARANARAGLPYDGVAVELHYACATGDISFEPAQEG